MPPWVLRNPQVTTPLPPPSPPPPPLLHELLGKGEARRNELYMEENAMVVVDLLNDKANGNAALWTRLQRQRLSHSALR